MTKESPRTTKPRAPFTAVYQALMLSRNVPARRPSGDPRNKRRGVMLRQIHTDTLAVIEALIKLGY